MSMACIPLAVFIFCFRGYFVAPVTGPAFAAFLASIVLTAMLQFFISYAMAMLAFWFLEISTLIFILFAFEYLASGHLFPLDLLPAMLQHALWYTPFPSMLYVPIAIYMGKISGARIALGLGMQVMWLVLAYGLARFAWQRGIRKYAAFGG